MADISPEMIQAGRGILEQIQKIASDLENNDIMQAQMDAGQLRRLSGTLRQEVRNTAERAKTERRGHAGLYF